MLGVVPFINEGGRPLNHLINKGWDGRLYTDLSELTPENPDLPTEKFFIRTRYPDKLDASQPWKIQVGGLVEKPATLTMIDIFPLVKSMGNILLECSGNGKGGSFGLLSTASWDGAPLLDLLAKHVKPTAKATRLLVSGFDEHSTPSTHSTPGASWIFTFDQLKEFGAFLAIGMNGEPLPKDHGFPVRLLMPRWYGCTNIKWVNEIRYVDDQEPATSQMREFASRTHQSGTPTLARDYKPASIDQTAMATRVEQWRVNGKLIYRIIGLMWGGYRLTSALTIRTNPNETYQPLTLCPQPSSNNTWSIWSHAWQPKTPGTYKLQLNLSDQTIPKKRLDSGFYIREIQIDQV